MWRTYLRSNETSCYSQSQIFVSTAFATARSITSPKEMILWDCSKLTENPTLDLSRALWGRSNLSWTTRLLRFGPGRVGAMTALPWFISPFAYFFSRIINYGKSLNRSRFWCYFRILVSSLLKAISDTCRSQLGVREKCQFVKTSVQADFHEN